MGGLLPEALGPVNSSPPPMFPRQSKHCCLGAASRMRPQNRLDQAGSLTCLPHRSHNEPVPLRANCCSSFISEQESSEAAATALLPLPALSSYPHPTCRRKLRHSEVWFPGPDASWHSLSTSSVPVTLHVQFHDRLPKSWSQTFIVPLAR